MTESPRQAARRLAAHGRYGDSTLMHVHPLEVAGIASLVPGGLTINPDTGLPEAFLFLPLLASLFSAAAPAAAAATAAAPALLAGGAGLAGGLAAGAGTAAGLTAATAAPVAAAAAPSFLSGLTSGIGSLFGTGAAGTAGTTGAALAGGAGVNSLAGTAAADTIAAAAPTAAAATPAETAAFAAHAATVGPFAGGAGAAPYTPAISAAPEMPVIPGAGAYTAATGPLPEVTSAIPLARPEIATATTGGGIGDLFSSGNLMKGLIFAQMAKGLIPSGGKKNGGGSKPGAGKEKYSDEETRYRFDRGIPSSDTGEFVFRPGVVRGYANGGIVSLANGGGVDSQMQQPQDMSLPLNGVDNGQPMGDIPTSDFPSSQIGSPYSGDPANTVVAPTGNDKELIAMTIAAISGKIPNPEPIILQFIKNFGEQAFQDLVSKFKGMGGGQPGQSVPNDGRLISGPGTGTSDSVPAMINGQQQAALSDGEYVVPAQAVSALGGGSTNAGAQRLDQMVQAAKGGLISLGV